jgi:hypothetical protein
MTPKAVGPKSYAIKTIDTNYLHQIYVVSYCSCLPQSIPKNSWRYGAMQKEILAAIPLNKR